MCRTRQPGESSIAIILRAMFFLCGGFCGCCPLGDHKGIAKFNAAVEARVLTRLRSLLGGFPFFLYILFLSSSFLQILLSTTSQSEHPQHTVEHV